MLIILAQVLYQLIFLPDPTGLHVNFLVMNPPIRENVAQLLATHPLRLLLPYQYDPGRWYWPTTVILFTYYAEVYLGPVCSYLLFSTVFVLSSFSLGFLLTRSLLFASTVAFAFAFGTQNDFVFTLGNLTAFYLVQTYVAVNFSIGLLILSGRWSGWLAGSAFILSLLVVALSSEIWINYATGCILAILFVIAWSIHHRETNVLRRAAFLLFVMVFILGEYLIIRMQFVSQYLAPGAEEELLVTYRHGFLMIDDFIANLFTYLYMTLSNYLPSVISGSNSLTYLGSDVIIAGQTGYDAGHSNFVVMSHFFLWRFYAGVTVAVFFGAAGWVFVRSWRTSHLPPAIVAGLSLMILAGFATHLAIKMRPYTTTPSLSYKATMSIAAWTVMIAYLTTQAAETIQSHWKRRSLVASVWLCILAAALTRPHMKAMSMFQMQMFVLGDPLGHILRWLR
jgi:hypothetical protein